MRPLGFFVLLLSAIALADELPYAYDNAYHESPDDGYSTHKYFSSDSQAPRLKVFGPVSNHDDGLYTMLNPRGLAVEFPGPLILDRDGELVWTTSTYGNTYNLQAQEYKGEQYLTFWAGDVSADGHGHGYHYMLDSSYTQVRKIRAGNGLKADLHEFKITKEGTALVTVYEKLEVYVNSVSDHFTRGYIWDCLFQEIDLSTDAVLFEWRASEHYNLTDSFNPIDDQGTSQNPYNWFHINSIAKDDLGNYLISARYTYSITYISGATGHILWILGGRRNAFLDLSSGHATSFAFQHDARWHPTSTTTNPTLTLFDNSADESYTDVPKSRGMHVALNTTSHPMTATLVTAYVHPAHVLSISQGSLQVLPSGNVLIGFGYVGAFTEFTPNGSVVRDSHFEAAAAFYTGAAQSYRVLKFPWRGRPRSKPDVEICGDVVYVSWMGATDVKSWVVQHTRKWWTSEESWEVYESVARTGFETAIAFDEHVLRRYVRFVALDAAGNVLGVSRAVDWQFARKHVPGLLNLRDIYTLPVGLVAVLAIFVLGYVVVRRSIRVVVRWAWRTGGRVAGGLYSLLPTRVTVGAGGVADGDWGDGDGDWGDDDWDRVCEKGLPRELEDFDSGGGLSTAKVWR